MEEKSFDSNKSNEEDVKGKTMNKDFSVKDLIKPRKIETFGELPQEEVKQDFNVSQFVENQNLSDEEDLLHFNDYDDPIQTTPELDKTFEKLK